MRQLALTEAHLTKVHRSVEDAGPSPGVELFSEAEYEVWVQRMLAANPAPEAGVRLFAYGSLIWKPEIAQTAERVGVALGWHRSFCYRVLRHRGTAEAPGLMMALDRGGSCQGVVYDLARAAVAEELARLFRREFTIKPGNGLPRWIKIRTEAGVIPALSFVMNRGSPLYMGRLSAEKVAAVLARACGHWGSGAEYLRNTVQHLEARGIHDRALWRLQQLVAVEIDRVI
ncbi:gamma-glutamylcyclotransferase [Tabrizicola sp.]|uniref:gamma-glutamylcyclotransferase n=1 Tax=Tabrizicola sp. TaxID=2005166 RepID=UPI00286D2918|nr:gamma-glutamylcyclotransferase [Tabrizicola sp.]